jgi:hypothetical protein
MGKKVDNSTLIHYTLAQRANEGRTGKRQQAKANKQKKKNGKKKKTARRKSKGGKHENGKRKQTVDIPGKRFVSHHLPHRRRRTLV